MCGCVDAWMRGYVDAWMRGCMRECVINKHACCVSCDIAYMLDLGSCALVSCVHVACAVNLMK